MGSTLTLSETFADIYPRDTVLIPRSTMEAVRWAINDEYKLDSSTGSYLAIMGDMPLVCHRNVATPLIRDFFLEAGLRPAEHLDTYTTEHQAVEIVRRHVRDGRKLAFVYPPPADAYSDAALLVPLSVYFWLNNKANQEELIEPQYRPRSRLLAADSPSGLLDFLPDQGIFVKVCRNGVNGGGNDVFYCPAASDRTAALKWLASRGNSMTGIHVEEALEIPICWCINIAVSGSGVRYIGAAAQLFGSPAKQCGSRIDVVDSPLDEVIDIACRIAERARGLGFLGLAGIDIGISPAGRPWVFDLNFRPNACTPQVLLHEAAVSRANATVSQSWNGIIDGALGRALERIPGFASRGSFLPTRLYEATPESGGRSIISGILVGRTLEEIAAIETELRTALGKRLLQSSEYSLAWQSFAPCHTPE